MTPIHGGPSARRILTIAALAALTILAALPGVAAAAPAQRHVESIYGTRPPRIVTEAGTLDFFIGFSDRGGAFGEMAYWAPGKVPGVDFGWHGIEGFATRDGDRLTGEYFVIDSATSQPVGFANYVLDFAPVGEAVVEHETRQEGNLHTEIDTTRHVMSVTGTLTLPDGTTFAVSSTGLRSVSEVFTNDPASTVYDGSETFVRATWNVDGVEVIFSVVQSEIASESFVFVYDGGPEISGFVSPQIVDGHLAAAYELQRSGQIPVGSASVELTVTTLGSHAYFEVADGFRQRVVADDVAVGGALQVTVDGTTMLLDFADASVDTRQQTWHGIQRPMKDDGGGEG